MKDQKKKKRPYTPPQMIDLSGPGMIAEGDSTQGWCFNGSAPSQGACSFGFLPNTGCATGSGALLPVSCVTGSIATS